MLLRLVLIILVRYCWACQPQAGNPKLPEGNGRIFFVDDDRHVNIRGDVGGDEEFKMTVGRSVECGSEDPTKNATTKKEECNKPTEENISAYEFQDKCGERNYWCKYDGMQRKKYLMEICVDKEKSCADGFVLCYERYREKTDTEPGTLSPAPVIGKLHNNTPEWVTKCSADRLWAWRVWTSGTDLLFDVTENYMKRPPVGWTKRTYSVSMKESRVENDNGTGLCKVIDDASTMTGFAPGQRRYEGFTRMEHTMRFPVPYFEVKLKAYSAGNNCRLNITMLGPARECAVRWEVIGGCSNIAPTKLSTEPYRCTYTRSTGVTRVQQYGITSTISQNSSSTNTNDFGFRPIFAPDAFKKLYQGCQKKSGATATQTQFEQLSIDSVTQEKQDRHEFAVGAGESKVVKQLIMECDWFTVRTPHTQLVQGVPRIVSTFFLSLLLPMIALE